MRITMQRCFPRIKASAANTTFFLLLSVVNAVAGPRYSSRIVETKSGAIRGIIVDLNSKHLEPVEVFRGVPYAAAPTREKRYMPPYPPLPWKGTKLADTFPPVCLQKLPDISNKTVAFQSMPRGRYLQLRKLVPLLQNQSEDCLYLNLYVPGSGYGSTAPQTTAGRACVIIYGFFGCSIGILFFNLFLERIITLLAYILRSIHIRRLRKRIHQQQLEDAKLDSRRASRISRVPSELDEDSSLDSWKPSVYWVMLCLTLASVVVSSCAAAVYAPQENWTFFEALYFCFVSFATIGFGDLVSTQGESYEHVHWYRLGNFIFLVLGCCCIYSLFNVTSIVIKQALNWIIYKLDFRCLDDTSREAGRILRRHSMIVQKQRKMKRRRSSATVPNRLNKTQLAALFGQKSNSNCAKKGETLTEGDSDSPGDSEAGRRNSGEMISMKDFLQANKVSLAVMQKELYETAQMTRSGSYGYGRSFYGSSGREAPPGSFTPGTVGPLAILTQKLGEGDNR